MYIFALCFILKLFIMPRIYDYLGIIFLFHSREHKPIHVHVRYAEFENKLEIIYKDGKFKEVIVKAIGRRKRLPEPIMKDALRFAKIKQAQITAKWVDYFVRGKNVTFEKITKKI